MDLPPYDMLLVQARAAAAAEVRDAPGHPAAPAVPANLRWRNAAVIGGGAALLGGYAIANWWEDGFTGRFRSEREGDFGRGTEFHGIDKLGHVYFTYLATRTLAPLFEWIGNPPGSARRLAALTAWGAMSAMEVGDGFSRRYSFSPEDFAANTLGAVLGYAMLSNPALDEVVDLRFSYRPTPLSRWDPPGDYGGQRFHLVLKASGVEALRDVPVLGYLELNLGYGAPGVDTPDEWSLHDFAQRRREVLVGVGVDLARVVSDVFYGGRRSSTRTQRAAETAFELIQFPAWHYRAWNIDR